MERNFLYIGKRADGKLTWNTDLEDMKQIDGVTTVLKKVPIEEFEAADGLVRLINSEVFLGQTEAEKDEEEKRDKIIELKRHLERIDVESGAGRAFRKVAIDMGGMLSALRKVVIDFSGIAEMSNEAGGGTPTKLAPVENAALQKLLEFDPAENVDLQKITEWEHEAELVREMLRPPVG